jgi:hypothetical protein
MRPGYLSGYKELGLMIMLFGAKLFGKSIRCLEIHEYLFKSSKLVRELATTLKN